MILINFKGVNGVVRGIEFREVWVRLLGDDFVNLIFELSRYVVSIF